MQIGASALDIFGSPKVESIFSAGQAATATQEQLTARTAIHAQKREINRIHGYKLQLTPAETKRLGDIQGEIVDIERKAAKGQARADELDDRLELLKEADEIIGKPTIDIDADDTLAEYAQALDTLLQPKLDPSALARLEKLDRVKANIEDQLNQNPSSVTLLSRFQSISKLISDLTPPRPVSALSVSERKAYDDLAELINDHAGDKIQLSSRDAIRVSQLERSILKLQELLPEDPAQQPSAQAVARAYTRLA